MKNAGRILFGLVALFFMANGFGLVFFPAKMAVGLSVVPDGIAGLSNMRALWGAAIAAIGISVLIGAIKADFAHIRVGAIFILTVIAARFIGYFTDGSFDDFWKFVSVPTVAFIVMLIAHKLVASEKQVIQQ